jgi:hypothetical protein
MIVVDSDHPVQSLLLMMAAAAPALAGRSLKLMIFRPEID